MVASRLAVVVCSRHGDELLERQLDALRTQTIPIEVRVADAAGCARNDAWRATRAPLVAFTEDACRATPGWAEALVAAAANPSDALLHGPTLPVPEEWHVRGPLAVTVNRRFPDAWFPGTNVLYPRTLLERVGGFDEGISDPRLADADLAWRAIEGGAAPAWAASAVMHHRVLEPGACQRLATAARSGELALVVRRHPGLRAALPKRLFRDETHEGLVRAALALALPRRWRWLRWWLAAPYVSRLVESPRSTAAAPALVAVDLVEVAASVWGGMRYRTPLL